MSHFRVVEHTIRCQNVRERAGAVFDGHQNDLRLAVKQYIPLDNPHPQEGDVTLIGAHANGFPKELYEPLWDDIYEKLQQRKRRIRSIWIADVAQQGQSGILNESILGDDPSWFDHARDLLFLSNKFQDDISQPIIGIGHSMGGTQLAHLSLLHPSLLEGLVLIDPAIQLENPPHKYAASSTFRRDLWPTREEAIKNFQSSPFYQAWDPRVFEKWAEYGIRDLPTGLYPTFPEGTSAAVTLATTKAQELFTFVRSSYVDKRAGLPRGFPRQEMHDDSDNSPFYRPEPPQIFRRLPEIKPSVLYIFGETSDLSPPAGREEKVRITGTGIGGSGGAAQDRVSEVVLPCGHLVPMELVTETASASAQFIDRELSRWESRTLHFRNSWGKIPHRERTSIDEQWKKHIGSLPKRDKL